VTDAAPTDATDPWVLPDAAILLDISLDPARAVCLPEPDADAIGRAIVALANTRGGDVLVGVTPDGDGRITAFPGIDPSGFAEAVAAAVKAVDPPVSHLVQQRVAPAGEHMVGMLRVRLSPSAPHLLTADGGIYGVGRDGVQPIRSRRALDDLYARGRGERERADRLVEAMVERLSLGHYAFYTLAVIACTHEPSGEPYRVAQADARWLAPADDPFVAAFALHEHEAKASPGEVELRTPGDVNAFIRVTRSGCVAAGEVQRRPYHEELDTVTNIAARLTRISATAARLLAASGDALMLPQVFIEGVRGLRLVHDPQKRVLSGNAPQDTARYPLSLGDARDPAYVARISTEAMERLAALFPN
jgi:hypothetical protein